MPLKEIKLLMEIAVVAGLFTLSATFISNIFINLRARKDEKYEHERLNDKHLLLKEGQGNLSKEHDSLLIKQEKMLDKQISQESILMLLKQQMEDDRKNQDNIRANIGSELYKSVDSSIATLQILAEEIKKKNEEIKELKVIISDLTEENKQLSNEVKEYKISLDNDMRYEEALEDDKYELEL